MRYKSLLNSVWKHLFYGPGYTGEKDCPRTGHLSDVPEPEAPVKYLESPLEQYDDKKPNWNFNKKTVLAYVVIQLAYVFQACEVLKYSAYNVR